MIQIQIPNLNTKFPIFGCLRPSSSLTSKIRSTHFLYICAHLIHYEVSQTLVKADLHFSRFKNKTLEVVNNVVGHLCNGTEREDIVSCIKKESFDLKDFVKYEGKGKHFHITGQRNSVVEQNWRPDFSYVRSGLCQQFKTMDNFGEDIKKDAINVGLDPNNWYLTFIHDPRFFIFSRNPGLPLNSQFQKPDQLVMHKLKMVQHLNLNIPSKRCNNSPFYSFTKCVKQAVSNEVTNIFKTIKKWKPGLIFFFILLLLICWRQGLCAHILHILYIVDDGLLKDWL